MHHKSFINVLAQSSLQYLDILLTNESIISCSHDIDLYGFDDFNIIGYMFCLHFLNAKHLKMLKNVMYYYLMM